MEYRTFDKKGAGIDTVKLERFYKMDPDSLILLAKKILTDNELNIFDDSSDKPLRLACFFSMKEAVSKALGCGFRGIGFKDIEIGKDDLDRPVCSLSENALKIADENGMRAISVSLSHEKDSLVSLAIAYYD